MEQFINWIIENKEWIFSGIGIILLSVLAKFIFSRKQTSVLSPVPIVSSKDSSILINGSVNTIAHERSSVVIATGKVTIGITIEDYEAGLKRKEIEIRDSLTKLVTDDLEKRRILEKELATVRDSLLNLEVAFEMQKVKLVETSKALEDFHKNFVSEHLREAQIALCKGDLSLAKIIFKTVLEKGKKNAAKATYFLGILEETNIEFSAAQKHFYEAAYLEPQNAIYQDAAGRIAYILGDYGKAEMLFAKAIAAPGRGSKQTKQSHKAIYNNNLATVYQTQGKYNEAERLYKKTVSVWEKTLGAKHPYIGQCLNNLGGLLKSLGRYDESISLYNRILPLLEKAFSKNHLLFADCANNLAVVYNAKGWYKDAKPLYEQALRIRKKILGNNHPLVGQSLNNLAELYHTEGLLDEAEQLYCRSLSITETKLGQNHSEVAIILNNLAELYRLQKRYDEAESLYKRALDIRQKVFNSNHPLVGQSFNNLAQLYRLIGRYNEAEELYLQAKNIWETVLYPEHPDQGVILNNLADLYHTMGNYQKAESFYKSALKIREAALGPDHIDVAQTLRNMAGLYISREKLDKAESLYRKALTIREKSLGLEHPVVVATIHGYVNLLLLLGKMQDAIMMEARINEPIRKTIAKQFTEEVISRQKLNLWFNEKEELEREIEKKIKFPETAKGPIVITRTVSVSRGSSASSPVVNIRRF
jgi:tetratricopeptide (TPR) repeat protein